MYGLEIEKLENGNLRLFIPDSENRVDILDIIERNERDEIIIWCDLLEPFSCNGGYTPISPEAYAIGLTSDPYILGETVTPEDDGNLTVEGGLWHYNDYQIKSAVEELAEGREVILRQFHNTDGKPETIYAHK